MSPIVSSTFFSAGVRERGGDASSPGATLPPAVEQAAQLESRQDKPPGKLSSSEVPDVRLTLPPPVCAAHTAACRLAKRCDPSSAINSGSESISSTDVRKLTVHIRPEPENCFAILLFGPVHTRGGEKNCLDTFAGIAGDSFPPCQRLLIWMRENSHESETVRRITAAGRHIKI